MTLIKDIIWFPYTKNALFSSYVYVQECFTSQTVCIVVYAHKKQTLFKFNDDMLVPYPVYFSKTEWNAL